MQIFSWGIIGTGQIAATFAKSINKSKQGKLLAIASRDQESADSFGAAWEVPRRYDSYEKLLADKDVQIVYIAIPHSMHAQWSIKAAEAGKHIVCEKPLGLNYIEAAAIIDAARRNKVYLLEAFMYRFHPQTAMLIKLLRGGAIGEVQMIQTTFSIKANRNPEGRLFNNALGGGGIMDIGCYCTSFARIVAGASTGKNFAEPTNIRAVGHIGNTNVDEYATACLEFPQGIIAQIFCGIQVRAEMNATIYGTEGFISMPWPFTPIREGRWKAIVLKRDREEVKALFTELDDDLYTLEADIVCNDIDKLQSPGMTLDDTLGNMKVLDKWRAEIGLVFKTEWT